jgi:hypothetical protein
MKKFTCLLILCLAVTASVYAQTEPISFFRTMFIDLKSGNADDFVSHVITGAQFEELLSIRFKQELVNQDSLDKVPLSSDPGRIALVKKRFLLLSKQADSLNINLTEVSYKNCKFEEVKDPKILCTSLRGIIYFVCNGKDYQWIINEAVLIRGEWRILSSGHLSEGWDGNFLPDKPDHISAFGSMSKVRVKVVLSPPPVDSLKPPPPPPPLRNKKSSKN